MEKKVDEVKEAINNVTDQALEVMRAINEMLEKMLDYAIRWKNENKDTN